jgi:hypothetical protein
MNKKFLTILLMVLSVELSCAQIVPKENAGWLLPATTAQTQSEAIEQVPEQLFFEVAHSKAGTAIDWLTNRFAISLSHDDVQFFGQNNFDCPRALSPFLIRASYMHGGTGNFMLEKVGSDIIVIHASLGPIGPVHRTALVACLDVMPTKIFQSLPGAL